MPPVRLGLARLSQSRRDLPTIAHRFNGGTLALQQMSPEGTTELRFGSESKAPPAYQTNEKLRPVKAEPEGRKNRGGISRSGVKGRGVHAASTFASRLHRILQAQMKTRGGRARQSSARRLWHLKTR